MAKSKGAAGRKTRAISKAKAQKKEDETELNTSKESKSDETAPETKETETAKKNGEAADETKKGIIKFHDNLFIELGF